MHGPHDRGLMKGFIFRLVPPRPDFAFTMSEDERAIMLDHVGYWSRLAREGKVLEFGPVDDPEGPYGIGVVLAHDLGDAEVVRDEDPAMRSGRGFRTEIGPMLQLVTPAGRLDGAGG